MPGKARASMRSTTGYQPPRGWLRVGKYLFPLGAKSPGLLPTPAPRAQVPLAQLALDHPDSVRYQTVGPAEDVAEFAFNCHFEGKSETRQLPAQTFPPAFVGHVAHGASFGRKCCVIGPARKAVRETGFFLDGEVQTSKIPVSPWRIRYWRKRWTSDVTSRPWLPPRKRICGRIAVLNARYCHNYFHWLIEILPRLVTMRRAGISADFYLVDCLRTYQQNALAALGIERHQLIQPHFKLLLEADEIVVPSFPSPQCLRDLGPALLSGFGQVAPAVSTRRVFISRRETGTRTLANEPQVERLLHAHGFETHFMEQYPLAKQARLIHDAEIVVGTHGAGLANLVFARPGTRVIEIVPAGRFNYACYPKRTRFFGLQHQLVFAACPGRKQVLHPAIDDLAAALAEAEHSLHNAAA